MQVALVGDGKKSANRWKKRKLDVHVCSPEEELKLFSRTPGRKLRMCLSDRNNITLSSNEDYGERSFIEYLVVECDNATSKVTCKPRD